MRDQGESFGITNEGLAMRLSRLRLPIKSSNDTNLGSSSTRRLFSSSSMNFQIHTNIKGFMMMMAVAVGEDDADKKTRCD